MQQEQRNPKIARDKTRVSSDLLSLYDTEGERERSTGTQPIQPSFTNLNPGPRKPQDKNQEQ